MLLRHLAPGDRDEAREPGLRRQQVVVRGREASRPFGVGQPEADREDSARTIVEKLPVHGVGETVAAAGEVVKSSAQRVGCGRASRQPDERLAEQLAPLGDLVGFRACRRDHRHLLERGAQILGALAASLAPCARRPAGAERRTQRVQFPLGEAAARAQRRRCVRPARQRLQRLGQHPRGIRGASAHSFFVFCAPGKLAQPGGQRHQRARQIAAVHGRDVARGQRRQASRVVPVEQVSFVAFECFDGRERALDPVRKLA